MYMYIHTHRIQPHTRTDLVVQVIQSEGDGQDQLPGRVHVEGVEGRVQLVALGAAHHVGLWVRVCVWGTVEVRMRTRNFRSCACFQRPAARPERSIEQRVRPSVRLVLDEAYLEGGVHDLHDQLGAAHARVLVARAVHEPADVGVPHRGEDAPLPVCICVHVC